MNVTDRFAKQLAITEEGVPHIQFRRGNRRKPSKIVAMHANAVSLISQ